MARKTIKELESQLALEERLNTEREKSDKRYAAKIVQYIVFWVVAILAGAVIVGVANTYTKKSQDYLTNIPQNEEDHVK